MNDDTQLILIHTKPDLRTPPSHLTAILLGLILAGLICAAVTW